MTVSASASGRKRLKIDKSCATHRRQIPLRADGEIMNRAFWMSVLACPSRDTAPLAGVSPSASLVLLVVVVRAMNGINSAISPPEASIALLAFHCSSFMHSSHRRRCPPHGVTRIIVGRQARCPCKSSCPINPAPYSATRGADDGGMNARQFRPAWPRPLRQHKVD